MPMYDVTLGRDVETDQFIKIGDMERRSGLYILGRPGSGKTTLIKKIIAQDIENDHGVFFLDPHGDAIDDLLQRIPPKRRDDVYVIDPTDETHTFGMNLLACSDISRLDEREKTFDRAKGIFTKLFANPQTGTLDVLLDKYLRNSFYPLIVNQGYTIAEIPLVLTDKQFRDHLLQHPMIAKDYPEVVRFWHTEFAQLSPIDQRNEVQSTLTRLGSFTRPYIQHIVGQSQTRLDFTKIMDNRKILFVKLSTNLSDDHKRIIGTILVSHLVRAVFQRDTLPEHERIHFCIFIDEFQNFAGSEDFAILFTQGRKFAVATTIAHHERFGQFADNKAILGATDAAGNKIFFQLAVRDAEEQAAEVQKPSPTEIKHERHLGVSQNPFAALLQGHKHPDIHRFMQQYLRPLQHRLEDAKEDIEYERLLRQVILDEAALSRVDERYEAIQASLARGRAIPVSYAALQNTEQILVQVREHTERLIRLHDIARGLRLSLRSLNTFLTAIMEGAILPVRGEELFSHFLLAFVRLSVPVSDAASQAFALYVSLVYGNPELPRSIPITLAARYQAVSHEELYRSVEAQYIRQVHAVAEQDRQEALAERNEKRQIEYERVLRKILTWKREARRIDGSLERESRYMQALNHAPVRKFLTPYLFKQFAPPWYCGEPNEPPAPLRVPSDATPEMQSLLRFLHQYGQGCFVVMALLRAAFRGQGQDSTNASEPSPFPPSLPWHPTPYHVPNIRDFYPHLHMLELPAIAGMEPFQVWQTVRELNALLLTCGTGMHHDIIANELVSLAPPVLRLDDRHDAMLLLAQVETDFPNAQGLRSLWGSLTEEDIQFVGRRHDRLAWVVGKRYNRVPQQAKDEVYYLIADYKKKQSRQLGQMLTLPYALERTWYRCDEMTRTYLIARACDLVTYGDVVADRTFPQPTLAGIPPQEVSATVAVLIDLLLQAQAQENATEKQRHAHGVEKLVRECLWKRDGLLHLEVYQAEGRVHMRQPAWRYLPPRVLTHQERTTLTAGCLKELASADSALAALDAFVTFCQLLRQPENHVRTATQVYVDREVNTYTTAEMTNQMVQELINLYPHSAYVKSTWKGKIQTLDVSVEPGAFLTAGSGELVDARRIARQDAERLGILRRRIVIEEEIRERQSNWRRRGGDELPPPTSTSDTSRPSLPIGRTQNDEEPPPTSSISEKTPEEKPNQARNGVTGERSQIIDQPRSSSEKTPAQKPPGSSKGRKEGAVQKRRTKQKTGQEAPKREEKHAALREKLIPIVRRYMLHYEEKSKTEEYHRFQTSDSYKGVVCALALRDREIAERLIKIVTGEYQWTIFLEARVATLLGDETRARQIIKTCEYTLDPNLAYYYSGYIASELLDLKLANICIRQLEEIRNIEYASKIALRIGDKETIRRFMQEADQQEWVFQSINPVLADIALIHPAIAKKLLERIENRMNRIEDRNVFCTGIMAAALGERPAARRAMDILINKGTYQGYVIAAILGDLSIAEEMMWKDIETFKYSCGYTYVQNTIARLNPEAAFYLMQALEKEGYDVGLIPAKVLEHLGSVAS